MKIVTAPVVISCLVSFAVASALLGGSAFAQIAAVDQLVNNNAGSSGTSRFTQSETSLLAFGNSVVVGFNDSGSNANGSRFTGWSYSVDGGATFTDGGILPANAGGDAGDPLLARDATTGRIYLVTLGFTISTLQVFRSDDNGVTWSVPVNGTPGGSSEDKPWMAVDNFPGAGNGNVYIASRSFGGGNGIRLYRSLDQGVTFGPNGGVLVTTGQQGAYVAIGPDHAVYVFWLASSTLQMRKSADLGLTFGAPVTVVSGLTAPGINGDLGLTGIRQGLVSASAFRSNSFPHAAINPVTGHLYLTYNDNVPGTDKADVFMVMSTDGGATWSTPTRVNDDVTTTDQWMPTIAVTPAGDQLGIFYYSRQEDAGNNLFKYYGRVGAITGSTVTFSPSVAISDTPSLPEFGRDSVVNSVYMGDYNVACGVDGVFHVVWSDNRDDLAGGAPRKDPNVYYDQVAVGNVSVAESTSPLAARLSPAAPNPFRSTTVLAFEQPAEDEVTVNVYSPTGALIRTITQGRLSAGRHEVVWNGEGSGGRPLPAGVYFVRLQAGNFTTQRKVVKLP